MTSKILAPGECASRGDTYLDTIAQLSTPPSQVDSREAIFRALAESVRARDVKRHLSYLLPNDHPARGKFWFRAVAKLLTESLVERLSLLDSPLRASYLKSLECASYLTLAHASVDEQTGEYAGIVKARSKFCKQRWCIVCNHNSIGKGLYQYADTVLRWEHPTFVTLTVRNVKADELEPCIRSMIQTLRRILQSKTGRKMRVAGIRKLECTYNPTRNDYHPHLHLVVNSYEAGEWLRDAWLERYGSRYALPKAQDVRLVDKSKGEKSIAELFKYYNKIAVKYKLEQLINDSAARGRAVWVESEKMFETSEGMRMKQVQTVDVQALDVMFRAMHRVRATQPFGRVKARPAPTKTPWPDYLEERALVYYWAKSLANWIEPQTGRCLARKPPKEDKKQP